MKRFAAWVAVISGLGWSGAPARAAEYFWNGTTGGDGSWTDAGALWASPTADALPLVAWPGGNNAAVFGGVGGTVTLDSAGLSATGLSFLVDGYTIAGPNSLRLSHGTLNTLTVGVGVATISADIVSTNGNVYKTGAGALNLNGGWLATNKEFSVRGGTVNVAGTSLAFNKLIIGAGGAPSTLNWSNGTGSVFNNYWGIGDGAGANGTMTISGGSVSVGGAGSLFLGQATMGRLTIAGGAGSVTGSGNLWIGAGYNGARTEICTGVLTVASGTFTFAGSGSIKLSNIAGQSGSIHLDGGTFVLNGRPITMGAGTANVVFNGGTLQLSATNGAIFGAGLAPVIEAGGAVFDTAGMAGTIAVPLVAGTGDGGVTKLGAGTLTLAGNNTYAGGTLISAGTLQIGAGGTSGTLGGGPVTNNGTLAYNRSDDQDWTQAIVGSGGITKLGAGTLTLSGNNSYAGTAAVNAGVLRIGSASALPGALPKVSFGGGTLDVNGLSLTLDGINGGSGAVSNSGAHATLTINTRSLASPVAIRGDLDLVIAKGSGVWQVLSSDNTYSGTTTVDSAALLSVQTAGGLGGTSAGTTVNGTLELKSTAGSATWVDEPLTLNNGGRLSGHSNGGTRTYGWTGPVSLPSGTATVDVQANVSLTLSGPVSGNGALVKNSPGSLIVPAGTTNSYAGTTAVSGGTLTIDGVHTGGGLITVAAGATLGGTGTVGAVALSAGAKLSPGSSAGTMTIDGNLDLTATGGSNSGDLVFELGAAAYDRVVLESGTLGIGSGVLGFNDFLFTDLGDLAPGVYTLLATPGAVSGALDAADLTGSIGTLSGTLSLGDSGTDLVLTVVPEPGALGLLGLGVAALVLRRRRG